MAEVEGGKAIHTSVLLQECLDFLAVCAGGLYVDGTLGLGGHTEAILKRSAPDGRVIAFEWDENALQLSRKRLAPFGDRVTIVRRNFAELGAGLTELGVKEIDGLLIDIGLSSLQLDMGARGFSFRQDEFLDMRMDNRRTQTAADIIRSATERELADIFFYYGEERQARRLAETIVARRKEEDINTTGQLAGLVAEAIPKRFHPPKIHVATKVFQALRIAVNGELENLAQILEDGPPFLVPGGRFCVISFHSLEDRIVKRKFKENPVLTVVTGRPIGPSAEEVAGNSRARSARLRVAAKRE
jgi:16S rRNA (cytosine1402-N4)-methyltransferase